jgi:uncharacterized surface protein with fasciclin (FAS1) repeats
MKRYTLLIAVLAIVMTIVSCSETMTGPDGYNSTEEAINLSRKTPDSVKRMAGLRPGDMTIAEIAEDAGFTLLLGAVGYIADTNPESMLIAGLLNNDQYTVFAPTDEAFLNLVGAVESLLDSTIVANDGPFAAIDDLLGAGTIEAVVSYHVTEGRRGSNSVLPKKKDRKIETLLEGAFFYVSPYGMITAVGNTANIVQADISASNGVIHVIDAVILPVDLGL